ncbi:MAG: uncharacterized protein QOE19_2295 [Actinomycetota bacterium]|nr:uncharacterized protein [Actinomycetota bacterium]
MAESDPTASDLTEHTLSRRSLLSRGAATGLGIALTGGVGAVLGGDAAEAAAGTRETAAVRRRPGYGPLVRDPRGRLALPAGFRYTVVAQSGVTRLESGQPTPDAPDGSASFVRPGGNGSVLVNNHEIRENPVNPVPHVPGLVYDAGAFGGTTNVVVDGQGRRVREYVSLAGTAVNCAGGKTPWRTWLSCEETDAVPGPTNSLQKRHGYVFEVDPYDQAANRNPEPIKALGRFEHEAVAVDPDTGQIYETEDANNPHGLFYRWTPPRSALPLRKGSLKALGDGAGTLQALRARSRGRVVQDLCVATRIGTTYDVEWVTVPDRDASSVPVRRQFNGSWTDGTRTVRRRDGKTVTRSRKLEGAWWGDGGAYFVASFARTDDGSAVQHDGQVWFLDPLDDTIRLVLRFAYTPADQNTDPDGPDNIAVSPYGGVLIAEDGEGKQHLVGATDGGATFFVARNDLAGDGEMTGPNYSHDKKTLFVNVYAPGHVFAVTGPWKKRKG